MVAISVIITSKVITEERLSFRMPSAAARIPCSAATLCPVAPGTERRDELTEPQVTLERGDPSASLKPVGNKPPSLISVVVF